MTDDQIPAFPRIDATFREDGTVDVAVLGVSNVQPDRERALAYLQELAAAPDFGRPIRVHTHTGGQADASRLIVTPHGTYYDEDVPTDVFTLEATSTVVEPPAVEAPTPPAPPAPPAAAAAPPPAAPVPPAASPTPSAQPVAATPAPAQRRSFIEMPSTTEPARQGWRGSLNRMGLRLAPSPAEQEWRTDAAAVEQHWPGPRTVAITNPKGGAAKTSTTVLLSAIFARYGGAGVLAWDNNETRGTLAWRTERGAHHATVLDLLPQVDQLLSTGAQSAEMSYFAHHQRKDKFDVLQSDQSVEGDHEVSAGDVEQIHRVASRYYRMVVMDSGNSERAANWRAMIERSNALVVPCTNRADTAENGALMLEALRGRDDHSRHLAENAVVIVSNATGKKAEPRIRDIADNYASLVREVVTIPYDPALVEGVIHYDALRPATQRAWLRAAAAVARGL